MQKIKKGILAIGIILLIFGIFLYLQGNNVIEKYAEINGPIGHIKKLVKVLD